MRTYWFLLAFTAVVACKGKDAKVDDKSYKQTKQSLAEKEKNNPTGFLTISSQHDRKRMFGLGRQTVVKGSVTNMATVCSYKDVRIQLLAFDKEGKRVEEHEDIISGVIAPGAYADYKVHYKLPKTTDSISMAIMSATPIVDTTKK